MEIKQGSLSCLKRVNSHGNLQIPMSEGLKVISLLATEDEWLPSVKLLAATARSMEDQRPFQSKISPNLNA